MAIRPEPIIIKRHRRTKRRRANNGSWKIAFADFTLAMMALFMVLWIVQIADQQERTMIVQYIRGELINKGPVNPFNLGLSPSPIDFQGSLAIQQAVMPATATGTDKAGPAMHHYIPEGVNNPKLGKGSERNSLVPGKFHNQAQLEFLAREVIDIIDDEGMAANVVLQIVPQGIRILVHDNVNQFMFTRGSADMQPYFEDLLLALGPVLGRVENKISISGHTDSSPYAGRTFTNWELSSQRALLARRVLEYGGVKRNQIIQVTGMANQAPYIVEDPAAAANRRIEILVLTSATEQILREMSGLPQEGTTPAVQPRKAQLAAQQNQPRQRYPEQWVQ